MFDSHKLYQGPYVGNAPDFLVGYNHGYRVSWDCATGMISGPVFEDNTKAWSGDHGVDPRIVPGVFFCTHKVDTEDPALMDVAPTAMRLFGLKIPPHMDGKTLYDDESLGSGRLSDLPAEERMARTLGRCFLLAMAVAAWPCGWLLAVEGGARRLGQEGDRVGLRWDGL